MASPTDPELFSRKERKEHKEKNRIFPVKALIFPQAFFLCVLCVLLWLKRL
jgi:hypothetical protein